MYGQARPTNRGCAGACHCVPIVHDSDTVHAALLKLSALQARAVLRRAWRGLRTVKGAVLAALGLGIFMLWLVPAAVVATQAPRVDSQLVRDYGPLALLILTVSSAIAGGDKAIAFTPAEVNFLFPAPFTRRQLLVYKLSKAAAGSVLLALLLSLAMRRFSPWWPAAFVGATLALLLVSLCTTAAGLLRQSVAARLFTPMRQAVAYGLLLTVAGVTALVIARGAPVVESATLLVRAPAARLFLAPFQPFARAYVADDAFELFAWGSAALLIVAAMFLLVMRLDADYLEAAAAAGERAYEQSERVRRGEWMPGVGLAGTRAHVPPFPFLAGAGPVAWRQLTTLLRRSTKLLFVAVVCIAGTVPILLIARRSPNAQGAIIPAVGWLTILLVGALRFDFRGDIDQMPWLKSLPLRPLPLTAGQLVVPTAGLVLFHLAACAGVFIALPPLRQPVFLAAALALPLDLLLVAIENLTFLLFPHRPGPPAELGQLGRQMVLIVLKLLITAVACGIAGGCAAVIFAVSGSLTAAVAVAVVVLGVEAMALVPLIGLAYSRYDPISDTPP